MKKITYKEWNKIGRFSYASKSLQKICNHKLEQTECGDYRRHQSVKLIPYILMFIPLHLIKIFVCAWDGGLKEYSIEPRKLGTDYLSKGSDCWKRADEIYNKK